MMDFARIEAWLQREDEELLYDTDGQAAYFAEALQDAREVRRGVIDAINGESRPSEIASISNEDFALVSSVEIGELTLNPGREITHGVAPDGTPRQQCRVTYDLFAPENLDDMQRCVDWQDSDASLTLEFPWQEGTQHYRATATGMHVVSIMRWGSGHMRVVFSHLEGRPGTVMLEQS